MLNVILTGITSFFTDISSEMVYPVIPLYLTISLGAKAATIGLIEGIAESLSALLKVFSGNISDRIGKRKSIAILGYSFSSIGKVVLFISKSWMGVLGGRVIDRFGKGIRVAPRDAIIADSTNEKIRGKAYGLHRTFDTMGACLGISIAYIFLLSTNNDYKKVFLLSLAPAILGIIVLFFVREKKVHKLSIPNSQGLKIKTLFNAWIKLDKKLKNFLIITIIFTVSNSSNMFILLRAKNLGFSSKNVILIYLFYNIIYALVSFPAGTLSDKIGRKKVIGFGYLLYALVYFSLGLINSEHIYLIWVIVGFYGIYMGLTEGVEKAFISDFSPVESRATLLGLHSTLVGIGLFPASFIAGILWDVFGASAPFYFGAFMGSIASLGFLFLL